MVRELLEEKAGFPAGMPRSRYRREIRGVLRDVSRVTTGPTRQYAQPACERFQDDPHVRLRPSDT